MANTSPGAVPVQPQPLTDEQIKAALGRPRYNQFGTGKDNAGYLWGFDQIAAAIRVLAAAPVQPQPYAYNSSATTYDRYLSK